MKNTYFQQRLFESFRKHSRNIALECGKQRITYRELDENSSYTAAVISSSGIKPGSFIGIYLHDRIDFITTMIGILKAGSVFVPLDPALPLQRVKNMIRLSRLQHIFAAPETNKDLLQPGNDHHDKLNYFVVDDNFYRRYDYGDTLPGPVAYTPEDQIYVYFTSGTTGTPKAIVGKNRSLLHFIDWEIDTFAVADSFRVSQFITPGFDAFLRDLFVPLCAGAVLCIPGDREILLDSAKAVSWIEEKEITLVHCVPSLFRLFNRPDLTAENYKSLKYVLLSGERIKPYDLRNWYDKIADRVQLVNLYGPTETTMIKTCYFIKQDDVNKKNIPVGKPMRGCQVFIMDQNRNFCGKNMVGEITIRTPYRTFGYFNDPGLNKEKFIPNPLNGDQKDLLYRTGDLGRILPDGNLELSGRSDRQVKIRGMRVELLEIENVLLQHPAVKESVVMGREDKNGDPFLCAYIITGSRNREEIQHIREHLARLLPDAMVPAFIIPLDNFPLTPNGKVDVKALPDPVSDAAAAYTPPRDELQQKLAAIWARVLGLKQEVIGIDSSFFDLGGHSLKVTVLAAQVHKELNTRLPLAKVFDAPTIRGLAEYIGAAEEQKYRLIELVEEREYYRVSPAQKRFYLLQQMDSQSTAYNIPQAVELQEEADADRIEQAFKKIIHRHEGFRTSFELIDGKPVQKIHRPQDIKFEIEYYEIGNMQEAAGVRGKQGSTEYGVGAQRAVPSDQECRGEPCVRPSGGIAVGAIKRFLRPFDLAIAPLLRVGLIKAPAGKYLLIVDMHHIISDGISHGILTADFASLYKEEELFPLPLRYRDYSRWQNNMHEDKQFKNRQEAFWLAEFAGETAPLNLPSDFPRPKVLSFAGTETGFDVGLEETDALKKIARQEEATLFMVLLTLFNILLARLSNREEVVIGTPAAGRNHPDLQGLIGPFINTLALKNYPAGGKTFNQLLQEVKAGSLQAFENQDYQFEDLVEKVTFSRDVSRNPLFNVMFVFYNIETKDVEIPGLNLLPGISENRTAKFDLTYLARETSRGLQFRLEYSTTLFKKETIDRFIRYFKSIVSGVIAQPGGKVAEIEILDEQEKNRLLYDFNRTAVDYPAHKSIHDLFAEQAERLPDNIALVGIEHQSLQSTYLTYRQLNRETDRLAAILLEKGMQSGSIAAVLGHRSAATILGLLAVLKAGGAYLSIDPEYPAKRINYLLQESRAALLVCSRFAAGTVKKLSSLGIQTVFIEDCRGEPLCSPEPTPPFGHPSREGISQGRGEPCVRPSGSSPSQPLNFSTSKLLSSPELLAYVLYTSGTTGNPKGAVVKHRNVVRLVKNTNFVRFSRDDRILQTGAFEFDASTFEIWGALLNGLRLYIAAKEEILQAEKLKHLLHKYKISILWLTSPFFNQVSRTDIKVFSKLTNLLVGGDVLSPVHINRVRRAFPGLNIINGYGPTENTTFSTTFLIDKEYKDNIPIGKPVANSTGYILDKTMNLSPIGVPGELFVGGDGVSRGYLNDPELTAEKFITAQAASFKPQASTSHKPQAQAKTHQLIYSSTHSLFYRTGDLTRWLPDGSIEFLGRIDQQVKIRGFRIELGEIENELLKHKDIREAVVVDRQSDNGDKYLCAYIVANMVGARRAVPLAHEQIVGLAREPDEEITPVGANLVFAPELREHLSRNLPDYMIPSYFIPLAEIPLTANGKVDRKALPEPAPFSGEEYAAPGDEIEEKLVEIWAEALGVTTSSGSGIGINDNFFAIGGHSLKAAHLTAVIHRELDVKVPLTEVFRTPTIRELAAYIRAAVKERYQKIGRTEKREYYKCSSAQKRFYIMQQLEAAVTGYNLPLIKKLDHGIRAEKLAKVFLKLITRHESLRTSFEIIKGEPAQKIHRPENIKFEIEYHEVDTMQEAAGVREKRGSIEYDVGAQGAVPLDQECRGEPCVRPSGKIAVGARRAVPSEPATCNSQPVTSIIEHFIRPFDLSCAPLLRVGIVKTAANAPILLVDMHHIITDGLSQEILVKEFLNLYEGQELTALPLQYRDFSEWQNSKEQQAVLENQGEYWLDEFHGKVPLLNLNTDFPRPQVRSFAGDSLEFEIENRKTEALRTIALEEECTLYMVLFALYFLLLAKLSGQDDIVVGTAVAGRSHGDLKNVIGLFFNTLPVRNRTAREQPFVEYLKEFKIKILQTFENQDYAFDSLVEELIDRDAIIRESGRNPVFDTMFAMQSFARGSGSRYGEGTRETGPQPVSKPGTAPEPFKYEAKAAKFDLVFNVVEHPGNIKVKVDYSTSLFKRATIEKIASYYIDIVSQVIADRHKRPVDIRISGELSGVKVDFSRDEYSDFGF